MDFAMAPENGYPRLFRPTDADLFSDGTLAVLDVAANILRYNKDVWELLLPQDRHRVMRTHSAVTKYYLTPHGDVIVL